MALGGIDLSRFEQFALDRDEIRGALRDGVKGINKSARRMLRSGVRSGLRQYSSKTKMRYRASRESEHPARVSGNMAKSVRMEAGRPRALRYAGKVTSPHTHLIFLGWRHARARRDVMADALDDNRVEIENALSNAIARAVTLT